MMSRIFEVDCVAGPGVVGDAAANCTIDGISWYCTFGTRIGRVDSMGGSIFFG